MSVDERVRSQANGVVVCSTPGASTTGFATAPVWQSFELQMRSVPLVMMYSCAAVPTSNVQGAEPMFVIDIERAGCTPEA